MTSIVFADSIGLINYSNGVVRMELLAHVPHAGQAPGVRSDKSGHLVMPVTGFANAFRAMQSLMEQLVAAGIISEGQLEPSESLSSSGQTPSMIIAANKKKKSH